LSEREDNQARVDAEHRRRHSNPTAPEAQLEAKLLRIQDDPRLTPSQRERTMRQLGVVGDSSALNTMILRREGLLREEENYSNEEE
jgi:hypothetical protein